MEKNRNILELLLSTLHLILINSKEVAELEFQLEELEGDYYTFLHKNSMDILLEDSVISQKEYSLAMSIRDGIISIQSELWNPYDFLNNIEWNDVRKKTKELLELLKSNPAAQSL